MKLKTVFVAGTAVFIAVIAVAFAASLWTQSGSWGEHVSTDFTVYRNSALTTLWSPGQSVVADPSVPYAQTFYFRNDGTVNIEITGTISFPTGTATVAWDPANHVVVPVGGNATMTLTLSNFSVDGGSWSLSFDSTRVLP